MNKKISFKLLLCCCALFVLSTTQLFAFSFSGKAGAELEYSRVYNSNTSYLQSHVISVKVIGNNYFDEKDMLGIEYGIGYTPYQSGTKRSIQGFSLNTAFSVKYDANDLLALQFSIGPEYFFQIFESIPTHTFGFYSSSTIEFKVARFLSLGLKGTYHLPILLTYKNTTKNVFAKNQLFGISFFMTYCY